MTRPLSFRDDAGDVFTYTDMQALAGTARWVPKRKAQVVRAIKAGVITEDEAIAWYRLTLEDLRIWQKQHLMDGISGLQVTKIQKRKLYRQP